MSESLTMAMLEKAYEAMMKTPRPIKTLSREQWLAWLHSGHPFWPIESEE